MRNTTLGQVVDETEGSLKTGPFGTKLSASEYASIGAPVISVGEVGYGELRVGAKTKRVPSSVIERMPEYLLEPGDVVFGRKGAVDRSAWVRAGESGYFLGSDGIRVRFGVGIDSRFMAYQLQSVRVREWLLQHAVGTTLASLNEPTLRSVPVAMPSLREQHAIAATLGALDDKIESNRREAAKAQQLGDALFVAASDETRAISDVATITMGSSPKGEALNEAGEGMPFYQGTRDFGYRFPSLRVWTESPLRTASQNDTLMSVRAPVGELNRASTACCIGRGVAAIHNDEQPSTLYYAMRSSGSAWDKFQGEGTVFASVNKKDVHSAKIRWVSGRGATELETQLSALDDRIASLEAESQHLAALRDVLLPEFLSGRIRVSETQDVA